MLIITKDEILQRIDYIRKIVVQGDRNGNCPIVKEQLLFLVDKLIVDNYMNKKKEEK